MESFGALLQETFPIEDEEIQKELNSLVQSVRGNNKAGKLTIELAVEPNGENRILIKVPTVNAKAPQPTRGSAIFYVDEQGGLTRRDPRQRTFEEMERR